MLRPLGPIGHCSAKLRRALAIEEELALSFTVRVKDVAKDAASPKRGGGNRWSRSADFSVPGPFHHRPVSSEGKVSFHFGLETVSKTSGGGCQITTPDGSKRLTVSAPADHDRYIDRPGAVDTIESDQFDRYAGRDGAVEWPEGEQRGLRTNISYDDAVREGYWRAVHRHERTPKPDRVVFEPDRLTHAAWSRVAEMPDLPEQAREIAAAFASTRGKRKARSFEIDPVDGRKLVTTIVKALGNPKWKPPAIRVAEGRGGRSQFRLTAEFPDGLDAAGRLAITDNFCAEMAEIGFMYVAAIHAPDHHNNRRNFHLHLAFHDRPAKLIDDKWDFEIAEPVPGQSGRVRYPHRQLKIAEFTRDPDGKGRRDHGATVMAKMRELFADLCNDELLRLGVDRLFDPRDFAAMGIERTPTKPLGTRAAPLEAAGVPTEVGISNTEVIWTAVLSEAQRDAQGRAQARRALRRRIEDARSALALLNSVTSNALSIRLEQQADALTASAAVLDAHEGELAEYDATLVMARARPDKAVDTCRRILDGIAAGKADRTDVSSRKKIEARLNEAASFLARIDRIDLANRPVLDAQRASVATARRELAATTAVVEPMLDSDVPALIAGHKAPTNDPRAVIDALLKRILAENLPVMSPTGTADSYRVPGISRDEFRALTVPALATMAQRRLGEIAVIQEKRMREAAADVARIGITDLERRWEAGDTQAGRSVKRARAYARHPVFERCLQEATAALALLELTTAAHQNAVTQGSGIWRGLGFGIASVLGWTKEASVESSTQFEAPASGSIVVPPVGTLPSQTSPLSTSRDDTVRALAAAILGDPDIRVIGAGGTLRIDTTAAPDWRLAADAFGDEPVVRDAVAARHASPWLDIAPGNRRRILDDVQSALVGATNRPVVRIGDTLEIRLADPRLQGIVRRWRSYGDLELVIEGAERFWTMKGDREQNHVTKVERPIDFGDSSTEPTKEPKRGLVDQAAAELAQLTALRNHQAGTGR